MVTLTIGRDFELELSCVGFFLRTARLGLHVMKAMSARRPELGETWIWTERDTDTAAHGRVGPLEWFGDWGWKQHKNLEAGAATD